MDQFSALGLSDNILKALPELGIETPSEIQQKAIPLLTSAYTDFIGLAQTGTGKTAAFGLPLLEAIELSLNHTQALVLAPTRELGQQIAEQLKAFSKYQKGVNVLAVYGGANIQGQIKDLRRNTQHIVIATPGRLIDLVKRNALDLSQISRLVLDEADEMLNMGFKDELDEILSFTPEEKVTWLFSATMSNDVRRIVKNYMENPEEVRVGKKDEVNKNIKHEFVYIRASDKQEALRRFIDLNPDMRGIIFCRTKMDTQNLSTDLRKLGYGIDAIHGDLTQNQRDKVMGLFKTHSINLLAATDVAARGIDVKDITHVIHFALPDDSEYYTHRSGRTARAGQEGISLTLATKRDQSKIKSLEKTLKISFEKIEVPSPQDIRESRIFQWAEQLNSATTEAGIPVELLEHVESLFEGFSKEQLLHKLIALEMDKLGNQGGNKDLNVREGRNNDRQERQGRDKKSNRERNERSGKDRKEDRKARNKETAEAPTDGRMIRFMMNIGKKEHVNKANLLRFICDEAGLSKRQIGTIEIQGRRSYFEVHSSAAEGLPAKFKHIDVNGRLLKVVRG